MLKLRKKEAMRIYEIFPDHPFKKSGLEDVPNFGKIRTEVYEILRGNEDTTAGIKFWYRQNIIYYGKRCSEFCEVCNILAKALKEFYTIDIDGNLIKK